jgi:thioredoxin-dependent peroxiredoxin
MLEIGKPAPTFSLRSDRGELVSLERLRGHPVVLYFYPKDDTPGCTKQACGIRDQYADFEAAGAVVLGVSPDSPDSHVRFRDKFGLPFGLLADENHAVAEAYGTWVEKNRYGRRSMGMQRAGFVIDAEGNLAAMKRPVKAEEHTDWALSELARLEGAAAGV